MQTQALYTKFAPKPNTIKVKGIGATSESLSTFWVRSMFAFQQFSKLLFYIIMNITIRDLYSLALGKIVSLVNLTFQMQSFSLNLFTESVTHGSFFLACNSTKQFVQKVLWYYIQPFFLSSYFWENKLVGCN